MQSVHITTTLEVEISSHLRCALDFILSYPLKNITRQRTKSNIPSSNHNYNQNQYGYYDNTSYYSTYNTQNEKKIKKKVLTRTCFSYLTQHAHHIQTYPAEHRTDTGLHCICKYCVYTSDHSTQQCQNQIFNRLFVRSGLEISPTIQPIWPNPLLYILSTQI